MGVNPLPDARLHGRRLALARAGWIGVAALAVGLYLASLPYHVDDRAYRCVAGACTPGQLLPEEIDALPRLGLSLGAYTWYTFLVSNAAITLAWLVAGLLIFRRRSDDRMGLFASLMMVTFVPMLTIEGRLTASHPLLQLAHGLLGVIGACSLATLLYLFPDGRFVPRWSRWLALALLVWQGARALLPAATPLGINLLVYFGVFAVGVGAQVYRYRRVSTPRQRQQTKWIAVALPLMPLSDLGVRGVLLPALFPALVQPGPGHVVYSMITIPLFATVPFMLVPAAFAVAILRHRLFDIDVVIRRALVYGGLTAGVVGIYALVVGAFGALFQARGDRAAALLATGVVAVAFGPLRDRLQRGVDRLLYGERDYPYAALSRLGRRLEGGVAPDAVLPLIVALIAQTLKLPYAAIALRRPDGRLEVRAAAGAPQAGATVALPLAHRGEPLGELIVAPRSGEAALGAADRRLLEDLARQAGAAAHAVRLTDALQRAREELVAAREEERRRLRRDLHDGLGPQLASLAFKAEAARNLLHRDADRADALLAAVADQAQGTIADIRRLVHALRPPALDELGLAGALRQHAAGSAGLRVEVEAPEALPPLPAAVEVAAYRIAQEAVTNAAKHARARRCVVCLAAEGAALRLEVADDGIGLPASRTPGVGLAAMRERAAELGGTLTVEALPGGGTRVAAELPLGAGPGDTRTGEAAGAAPAPPGERQSTEAMPPGAAAGME